MNGMNPLQSGIPKFSDVQHLFEDEVVCRRYLINYGVLKVKDNCNKCNRPYSLHSYDDKTNLYRCTVCGNKQSIYNGTFFSGSKLSINKIY